MKEKKNAISQNWGVTTVHFPPVNAAPQASQALQNVSDWCDWKRSFYSLSLLFFFASAALLSLREGSHSSPLSLYSRLGCSPAESLASPKVTLLSDKQWIPLARSSSHHRRPPRSHVYRGNKPKKVILLIIVYMNGFFCTCSCGGDKRTTEACEGRWKMVKWFHQWGQLGQHSRVAFSLFLFLSLIQKRGSGETDATPDTKNYSAMSAASSSNFLWQK